MPTLENLLSEIQQDSSLDKTNLGAESSRIPSLHSKYLKYRTIEKSQLKDIKREYEKLYKERWLFYLGKSDPQKYKEEKFELKVLRGDIDIFLNGDEQLSDARKRVDAQETKVELIEEFLKALMQRHWMLKNAIDWQKMLNGN